MTLSIKRLKEVLYYDEDSGNFTWLKGHARASVGMVAGYLLQTGYVFISVDTQRYLAHRLAFFYMSGRWPKDQIDHINHQRNDNAWVNLREATNRDNQRNRTKSPFNTSGVTGVYKHKEIWRARIQVDGETKNLGTFREFQDAVIARKKAEQQYGFHPNHGK